MATPKLLKYFKTFTSDKFGNIHLTGIQNIQPYSKVNMEIISYPKPTPNLEARVAMGKISGATLAQTVSTFALSARIRTYSVVGPELTVVIKGATPNSNVNIQAWVFIH